MNIDNSHVSTSSCAICLERLDEEANHGTTYLGCGHAFGRSCIIEWAKIKRTCPVCRSQMTDSELQEFQIQPPDTQLRQRYIKLAVHSALAAIGIYSLFRFLGEINAVMIMPLILLGAVKLDNRFPVPIRERIVRDVDIERDIPGIVSLIGVATGLVIAATTDYLYHRP